MLEVYCVSSVNSLHLQFALVQRNWHFNFNKHSPGLFTQTGYIIVWWKKLRIKREN